MMYTPSTLTSLGGLDSTGHLQNLAPLEFFFLSALEQVFQSLGLLQPLNFKISMITFKKHQFKQQLI